jgi:drug/metabolite transporter (DMT)-like permease
MKCGKEFRKLDRKSFLLCTLSGVFLALHFATWITSIKYTTIASATVLVNTHPVFIVILAYLFLGEKVNKKAAVSIAITIIGGIIISFGDKGLGSNIFFGDTLAILGAAFVSFYMIIGRIIRQKLSVTAYTFIVYLSCTITLLVLSLLTQTPLFPYELTDWAIFLALAVFCTILGHSIFNWSLQYIKPTFLSVATLGEPVFATIWAILIFSEIPNAYNIAGSLVILTGIFMFNKSEIIK